MRLRDLGGFVSQVVRDAAFVTPGLLAVPQREMLSFVQERTFLTALRHTPDVAAVITTEELAPLMHQVPGLAISANPRRAFVNFHNQLARDTDFYWTDFPTIIDPSARVHPRAYVAQTNVKIGPRTVIQPNATVLERCIIGADVVIRSGAMLGSVGFQSNQLEGELVEMEHAGGVLVHDRAQILANAVIASAVFRQFTTIGEDARIGNLAFISHNVQVGPRSFVGHLAAINGNVKIGADVWIGPNATLAHCINIGDGAQVSLGSAVAQDVAAGQHVTGNIAVEHRRYLRHVASIGR